MYEKESNGFTVNTSLFDENIEQYKQIFKQTDTFRIMMMYYKCAIMEITTKFNVLNEEFSLRNDRNPIETIKSRLKSPQSIIEKMQRRDIPVSIEAIEDNIFDIAGIRVMCPFEDDIYMLADCLLNQDDIKLIQKKDYIKSPKPNGYRSLHLLIETPIFLSEGKRIMKAEIQLRTIAMDFWASLEHQMNYKKDTSDINKLSDDLLDCATESAMLDNKMMKIRKKIDYVKNN